jgi:hypothetical protein
MWTGSLVNIMNVRVAVNQHPTVHQSGWMVMGCPGFFHWLAHLDFLFFSSALPFPSLVTVYIFSTGTTLTYLPTN